MCGKLIQRIKKLIQRIDVEGGCRKRVEARWWACGSKARGGGGTEWGEAKQHQSSRLATVLRSHWSMRRQSESIKQIHTEGYLAILLSYPSRRDWRI
jgi:hypothetical protein